MFSLFLGYFIFTKNHKELPKVSQLVTQSGHPAQQKTDIQRNSYNHDTVRLSVILLNVVTPFLRNFYQKFSFLSLAKKFQRFRIFLHILVQNLPTFDKLNASIV